MMTNEEKASAYDWMVSNAKVWSWQPSRYSENVTSGFAANGTGYSGYTFEQALKLAMADKCDV